MSQSVEKKNRKQRDAFFFGWRSVKILRCSRCLGGTEDSLFIIPYIADKKAASKVSRRRKFSYVTMDELSHLVAKVCLSETLVLGTTSEAVEFSMKNGEAERLVWRLLVVT